MKRNITKQECIIFWCAFWHYYTIKSVNEKTIAKIGLYWNVIHSTVHKRKSPRILLHLSRFMRFHIIKCISIFSCATSWTPSARTFMHYLKHRYTVVLYAGSLFRKRQCVWRFQLSASFLVIVSLVRPGNYMDQHRDQDQQRRTRTNSTCRCAASQVVFFYGNRVNSNLNTQAYRGVSSL